MSYIRTRYKAVDSNKGSAVFNTGVPIAGNGGQIRLGSYYIEDTVRKVSEGDGLYMSLEHYEQEGGRLNGNSPSAKFVNFYGTVYDQWANFPHHSIPDVPTDAQVALNAAARSNPSKPHVDVPSEVGQSADLITLLRLKGRNIIKHAGNLYLAKSFALDPIFRLVKDSHKFVDQFHRRMKVLQRMQAKGHYRKTTKHGPPGSKDGVYSKSGTYSKVVQSQGVFVTNDFFANTLLKVRATSTWFPTGNFNSLDAKSLRLLNHRILSGMKNGGVSPIDLHLIWELIPWSWLIDWFTGMGQFIELSNNTVNFVCGGVSVIRETDTTYECNGKTVAGVRVEPVRIVRHNYIRRPTVVAPYAALPILTPGQLGILASLKAVRLL